MADTGTGAGSCRTNRLEGVWCFRRAFRLIWHRFGSFGALSGQVEIFDFGRILASQPGEGVVLV